MVSARVPSHFNWPLRVICVCVCGGGLFGFIVRKVAEEGVAILRRRKSESAAFELAL